MIIENFPIILQSITHFNKKVKKSQETLEKEQKLLPSNILKKRKERRKRR